VRTFSTISSGALRAAAARPSSVAEPRTAGVPVSLSLRPHNLTAARHTPPASSLPALHGQSSATPARVNGAFYRSRPYGTAFGCR
jgi:hypothetical protein